ncbi:MAG: hypothetical protein H7Z71_05615 [Moraxellaceae bacterium]|nr:hypothetical protein [Pseudobdellovibrionaceae bacterium]
MNYYLGAELYEIQKKYNEVWKLLRQKYPKASGRVKFGSGGNFADINGSFTMLIKDNPEVFLDSEQKKKAKSLLMTNKDSSEEEIKKILFKAPLNPECEIAIIWDDLDYDLIAAFQTDELVDQKRTMQTRASIKIVLGVIGTNKGTNNG